jgi:uncharacterized coiled-coil DUF342 family protein/FtsZ-binding cell division protein ZapB
MESKASRKTASRPSSERVPAVDKATYDKRIEQLEATLKSLQAKQENVAKQVNTKTGGKEDFFRQRDAAKAALDANQVKVEAAEVEKQKINDAIQEKFKSNTNQMTEISTLQKSIGFKSVDEVNEKIANIEYKMQTQTLSLKQERDLIAEISKLKQVKPQLLKLKNLKEGKGVEDSVGGLKAEMTEVQKRIAVLRDERKTLSAAYGKIMEARKQTMSGVSDLVDEKDKIYKEIKKTQAALKEIKDEKFAKIRDFQAKLAEAKVARAERETIEKAYKEAEDKRRKLEKELANENELPFLEQIELAENTIRYCEKLKPVEAPVETKKSVAIKTIDGTSTVLINKNDREETYFYAPTKAKKQQGQKEAKKTSGSVTHSLDTLSIFATLRIDVPTSVKDAEPTILALKAKIEDLKKEQEKIIQERKSNRSAKEAALAEATKIADAAKAEWTKVNPNAE